MTVKEREWMGITGSWVSCNNYWFNNHYKQTLIRTYIQGIRDLLGLITSQMTLTMFKGVVPLCIRLPQLRHLFSRLTYHPLIQCTWLNIMLSFSIADNMYLIKMMLNMFALTINFNLLDFPHQNMFCDFSFKVFRL